MVLLKVEISDMTTVLGGSVMKPAQKLPLPGVMEPPM